MFNAEGNNKLLEVLPPVAPQVPHNAPRRFVNGTTRVLVVCPACKNGRWVRASLVDMGYKKTPYCTEHRGLSQVKRIKPGEFDHIEGVRVDYQRQAISAVGSRGSRVLHIWGICPDCGAERWVMANGIRSNGLTTRCPSCAGKRRDTAGPKSTLWTGGHTSANGYKMIHSSLLDPKTLEMAQRHLKHHRRYYYVHRLVALQHFGPEAIAEGMVIRHLDGDKENNDPRNLAYGSQSENVRDHVEDRREMKHWRKVALQLQEELKKYKGAST